MGYIYVAGSISLNFNLCGVIGHKATEFGEITALTSFKVILISVTVESP